MTPLSKSFKGKTSAPKTNRLSTTFKNSDRLIVGISGGPDSVFLLNQLLKPTLIDLAKPLRPEQVILAHVNFNLRGTDSKADQQFIEKLAKKLGLQLEVFQAHPAEQKGNLEENCRQIRYDFFENIRLKHQAKYILIGHHLNDQIETFFLNFARGSTLAGFSGMKAFDPTRHLIRPLLHLSKAEILIFLKKNRLQYRLDKSNQDLQFSRNRLRHLVIPEFEKLNSNFLQTAAQNLANLAENRQIIDQICQDWLSENLQFTSPQQLPAATPQTTTSKNKKGSPKTKNTHKSLPGQTSTLDYDTSRTAASIYSTQTSRPHITTSSLFFPLNSFLHQSPALQKKLLSFLYQSLHQKSLTSAQLSQIHQTLQKNRSGLQKEFGPQMIIAIVKSPKTQKRQVVIKSKFD